MSVAEIKKTKSNLIAWIEQLSDSNMLMVLDELRNAKTDKDWWDTISESQRKHIDEGIGDAENGRVISSNTFWNNLKNA